MSDLVPPIKMISPQVTPDADLVLWVHASDGKSFKYVVPDPAYFLEKAASALAGQNERMKIARFRAEDAYAEAYAKMKLA